VSPEKRRDEPQLADIEIGAAAKMKAIRFEKVPETEVRFPDSDERRSGSLTERENLPDEIEPGVTYRDAKIRWRAEAAVRSERPP
jgi:hypothetical protein